MAYYLDAPSLSLATAIYSNPELTVCAGDGVYSDGYITRVLTGCVLGPAKECPSCGSACGGYFDLCKDKNSILNINVDLGNSPGDVGAVIISFDPIVKPHGLLATYDGVTYNTFSSPYYGLLTAPTGLPAFIGELGKDCGLVSGSPHILPNYEYISGSYTPTGTTTAVSIASSQVQLTPAPPGLCVMVIPKPNLNPSQLSISIQAPCGDCFTLKVTCPTPLFPTYTSQVGISENAICQYPDDLIYYNAPVNGNGVLLGLFDYIFYDINGQIPASDGYYYAPTMLPSPYDWFFVSNGIITKMGQCTYNGFVIERCADGYTLVADTSVVGVSVGDFVKISDPLYSSCIWQVISQTAATPTVTINSIEPYTSCSDVCVYYSINNMTGSSVTAGYTDCAGLSQTISVSAYTETYVCARVGSVSIPGSPAGVVVSLDSCDCGF